MCLSSLGWSGIEMGQGVCDPWAQLELKWDRVFVMLGLNWNSNSTVCLLSLGWTGIKMGWCVILGLNWNSNRTLCLSSLGTTVIQTWPIHFNFKRPTKSNEKFWFYHSAHEYGWVLCTWIIVVSWYNTQLQPKQEAWHLLEWLLSGIILNLNKPSISYLKRTWEYPLFCLKTWGTSSCWCGRHCSKVLRCRTGARVSSSLVQGEIKGWEE